MDLRLENDPILKQTMPIYDFENPSEFLTEDLGLDSLADSMLVTVKINNGLGLAAPQVGCNLRMFVMKIAGINGLDDELLICVNPEIEQQSKEVTVDQEGCLSFPDLTLTVTRPANIYVSYYSVEGFVLRRWLTGVSARCFCHELDHLNGITFDTKVAKLSLKMAKDKRKKFIKRQKRRG